MKINVNDSILKNYKPYEDFLNENKGIGYLKIRAFSASKAVPIKDLKIEVTKEIGEYDILFFSGKTDSSGMINDIALPACNKPKSNLEVPICAVYNMLASKNNFNENFYNIKIYNGIKTIFDIDRGSYD